MISDDLENWMGKLSSNLKALPIIYLAIPGSHDSMSYSINDSSTPAPDAEPEIVHLYKLVPCVVRKWARTQSLSVSEQLNAGIRFFDLRMARQSCLGNYYFVHGLYCDKVEIPFEEIRAFLDSHPEEFVILDCQHFYAFDAADHQAFCKILLYYFEEILYVNDGDLQRCTLQRAIQRKKQVLIVYREYLPGPRSFWSSSDWPTPWPNKVNVSSLQRYLDESIKQRTPVRVFFFRISFESTSLSTFTYF